MNTDFSRSFYTVPQTADLLQVHENTVYNMIRRGEVEHYRVGNQIRIPVRELERMKVERSDRAAWHANNSSVIHEIYPTYYSTGKPCTLETQAGDVFDDADEWGQFYLDCYNADENEVEIMLEWMDHRGESVGTYSVSQVWSVYNDLRAAVENSADHIVMPPADDQHRHSD